MVINGYTWSLSACVSLRLVCKVKQNTLVSTALVCIYSGLFSDDCIHHNPAINARLIVCTSSETSAKEGNLIIQRLKKKNELFNVWLIQSALVWLLNGFNRRISQSAVIYLFFRNSLAVDRDAWWIKKKMIIVSFFLTHIWYGCLWRPRGYWQHPEKLYLPFPTEPRHPWRPESGVRTSLSG